MENWPTVVTWVLEFSIPGVVIAMLVLGAFEVRRHKNRKRMGTPVSSMYVNEFTAIFYGSKRMEMDHRDSQSMMREEDADGAPPLGVNLDKGTVVLRGTSPAVPADGRCR